MNAMLLAALLTVPLDSFNVVMTTLLHSEVTSWKAFPVCESSVSLCFHSHRHLWLFDSRERSQMASSSQCQQCNAQHKSTTAIALA